jgi:hypothetical protein
VVLKLINRLSFVAWRCGNHGWDVAIVFAGSIECHPRRKEWLAGGDLAKVGLELILMEQLRAILDWQVVVAC